ncbi:cytochrome c oxidase subunit 5A, mitochondrial-like [Mercenaria mercenaria]|uniref:cytochrome c oxidase subunit 5A, mitochondrial-like n=1 Tax=Mercenaria mercenaria TaxID=6596 RepID=UPI001E1E1C0E|nr:cytochrome c oxidase subunit 5A, mitochondrial-like [Mercenaria mercenaria]
MLRFVASRVVAVAKTTSKTQLLKSLPVVGVQRNCHTLDLPVRLPEEVKEGTNAEESFLNLLKSDQLTGYDIRSVMNQIQGYDEIPSPDVLDALMHACRRVNDYALAVRILEAVSFKCGKSDDTFSQLMQAIRPTLDKLGILTPEQMGYDKPELYLKSVFDIHK